MDSKRQLEFWAPEGDPAQETREGKTEGTGSRRGREMRLRERTDGKLERGREEAGRAGALGVEGLAQGSGLKHQHRKTK